MKPSQKCIDLIKKFEGCQTLAYRDPVGIYTIGYGRTEGVQKGMVISMLQAEQFLQQDLSNYSNAVSNLVRVPLNQNQFDALVDFTYNLGEGNLKKSTLLVYINEQQFDKAANEFLKWNLMGGKVSVGLTKRREAERTLFMELV